MPTTAAENRNHEVDEIVTPRSEPTGCQSSKLPGRAELLIVVTFCLFTSAVTWPYVTRLRDAVVDRGDPYLIAWILWWDYHQTFTDPLHLFNANLFLPPKVHAGVQREQLRIALLFFPLYALGLKPLTVHAIAMFFGFALWRLRCFPAGPNAHRLNRSWLGCRDCLCLCALPLSFDVSSGICIFTVDTTSL